MVVIHPKMKLKPQYPGKTISAWQNLPRNPYRDLIRVRGWGRVFEKRRKRAILRGNLISLVEGERKALCQRHYSTSVAVTNAVWCLLNTAAAAPGNGGGLDSVLCSVLTSSKAGKLLDFRTRLFCVCLRGIGSRDTVTLKIVSAPGDLGSTVYTIMLPLEK
jgi:hypothetical protein